MGKYAILLRGLQRYEAQLTECHIAVSDFFRESQYKDSTGRTLPCYCITKKGYEFIAHKLTGTKGTEFTARYINKFHEMETGGNLEELAEMRAAVEAQGRLLKGISRQLSRGIGIAGTGSRTGADMYRGEIVRMVGIMQNEKALQMVYTFAKYVSQ